MDITQCHINKCLFHDGVLNAECESTAAASRWRFSVAFTSKNICQSGMIPQRSFRGKKMLILICISLIGYFIPLTHDI